MLQDFLVWMFGKELLIGLVVFVIGAAIIACGWCHAFRDIEGC